MSIAADEHNKRADRVAPALQARGSRKIIPSRMCKKMNPSDLIYDWNRLVPTNLLPTGPVLLNDETLRDGLQSPSVRDPSIEQKIEILHLMESLGINALDLGLPGAGARAVTHIEALAREIVARTG
jgi:Isopropylmalate/homocitrate/citramalate synthases